MKSVFLAVEMQTAPEFHFFPQHSSKDRSQSELPPASFVSENGTASTLWKVELFSGAEFCYRHASIIILNFGGGLVWPV